MAWGARTGRPGHRWRSSSHPNPSLSAARIAAGAAPRVRLDAVMGPMHELHHLAIDAAGQDAELLPAPTLALGARRAGSSGPSSRRTGRALREARSRAMSPRAGHPGRPSTRREARSLSSARERIARTELRSAHASRPRPPRARDRCGRLHRQPPSAPGLRATMRCPFRAADAHLGAFAERIDAARSHVGRHGSRARVRRTRRAAGIRSRRSQAVSTLSDRVFSNTPGRPDRYCVVPGSSCHSSLPA